MERATAIAQPVDRWARPLGALRVSVTDRCNMRCRYCMPETEYAWLSRSSILTFEEIARLAGIFAALGAERIRLTGGEPLLRRDLDRLVAMLRCHDRIRDLALTTNGLLLASLADRLRQAGLDRVTVSLDTLCPERLRRFARTPRHADIVAGIRSARRAGFETIKINTVVLRGFNDDELANLLEFGRDEGVDVRFIEYMDVGGATQWSSDQVVSRGEMLGLLSRRYGRIEPVGLEHRGAAPVERFRLADGTTFGIIASVTMPFCRTCDRSRITADGTWLLCLYADTGLDLRSMLREGHSDAEITKRIAQRWSGRDDRGAVARLGLTERRALHQIAALRADTRREMHTRGG